MILPMFHKKTGHRSGSRLLCIFLNGLLISLYSDIRATIRAKAPHFRTRTEWACFQRLAAIAAERPPDRKSVV